MSTNLTSESPIVADAHALYLAFGGRQHRRIEAAMRAKGYARFSRRVFHDRLERGKLRYGWIRRFKWNENGSGPPGLAGGMTRLRNPQRNADAHVRNDAASASKRIEHSRTADERDRSQPARSGPQSRKRRRAEIKAFRRWLQRVAPTMKWDWPHLKLLYRKLADVTSGKTKRLMIFMPPRHGKSELGRSVILPIG